MAGTITPRLAPGFVSIYGAASIYGFGHSPNVAFGRIHAMSISNSGAYSLGQNVLVPYKGSNFVSYAGIQYWLIEESKIILIEQEEGDIS